MHFSFSASQGIIILKITDNTNTTHLINTPLRIAPDQWDTVKERPYNIYKKEGKNLNGRLDRLRVGIAEYLNEVQKQNKILSLQGLQGQIKKQCNKSLDTYSEGTFLYETQRYIQSRTHLITPATYKRYMVFFRLFERFEGHQKKHFMLKDVGALFVKEFLSFGASEQYSPSTIIRSLHFVCTVLNHLEKRGIRTLAYEFEIPKEPVRQKKFATLNQEELSVIQNTPVPIELEKAKQWLLISCYSGQRVSDFMNFNDQMVQKLLDKPCIEFVQQKTQKPILLPLHPVIQNILKSRNGQFPEKVPYETYNRQIKEVVRLSRIDRLVRLRKRFGFRSKEVIVPLSEAVSTHIGRRSFASNFYGKIPTALLMEATGHSTEQMFQRYVGNTNTSRAQELGNYFEASYKTPKAA